MKSWAETDSTILSYFRRVGEGFVGALFGAHSALPDYDQVVLLLGAALAVVVGAVGTAALLLEHELVVGHVHDGVHLVVREAVVVVQPDLGAAHVLDDERAGVGVERHLDGERVVGLEAERCVLREDPHARRLPLHQGLVAGVGVGVPGVQVDGGARREQPKRAVVTLVAAPGRHTPHHEEHTEEHGR